MTRQKVLITEADGRPMVLSRRRIVSGFGAAAALPAFPAHAAFSHAGWRLDDSKVRRVVSPTTAASLRAQIDIVEGLRIKPEIKSFFRGIPVELDPAQTSGPGRYGKGRIIMGIQPSPNENPVFLHELLHAYHHQRLPGGLGNADVRRFMENARRSGAFPSDAYMLSNVGEYFAMTTSVVLWGRAARPPSTRETVQRVQPVFYDWIISEFALQL